MLECAGPRLSDQVMSKSLISRTEVLRLVTPAASVTDKLVIYLKNKIFLFVTRDSDLWFVNQEGSDRPRIENSLSNLHKNRHGK